MYSKDKNAGGPWTAAPASKHAVMYTASSAAGKAPNSTWRAAGQHYAAFWLVTQHGVRPSLAGTVAELAGLRGVR